MENKNFFFTKILFLTSLVCVDFFLEFLANGFNTCKIDFSPVLLHPARNILLRLIWGTALRQYLPNNAVGHRYVLTLQYLHTNRIPRSHKSS